VSTVPLAYDDSGAGPPLVILHGLFGSARNWQGYAKALSSRHRVIAVDLRNHGRSPHDPRHDYAVMAADVGALLDQLNLQEVVLLGHSMGGKAAMTLALTTPARLARLIVVDIAPCAYADQHTAVIDAMLALPLADLQRRHQAETLLAAAVPERDIRLFLLQNLQMQPTGARWRLNLPALRAAMPALIGALPVAAEARFEGPVHFIRGALSDRVRDEDLAASRHCFPQLQAHTVAAAGHWPHAEAPAAFTACLNQALG